MALFDFLRRDDDDENTLRTNPFMRQSGYRVMDAPASLVGPQTSSERSFLQRAAGFLPAARNVVEAVTQPSTAILRAAQKPAVKEAASGIAGAVLQAPQRALTSVALDPAAALTGRVLGRDVEPVFQPTSRFERTIFGEEPIVGAQQRTAESQKQTQQFLASKGVQPDVAAGMSLALAPLAIGGLTAADVGPLGGSGKKTGTEVGKRLISRYGDDAIRALRTLKSGDQRAISLLPKALKNDVIQSTSRLGTGGIDEVLTKYVGSINTERIGVTSKGERVLRSFSKELEAVKGAPVTQKEVLEASRSADLLKNVVSRESSLEQIASIKATRDQLARDLNAGTVTPELIERMRTVSSIAADTGRKLNAFRYTADPSGNIKENLLRQLIRLSDDTDAIVNAAKGVNFDSPTEVSALYRQFVKPKATEIVEEMRYINMLSSPQTHVVNVTSNAIQAGLLAPATRGAEAAVDFVTSLVPGQQREVFFREVPAYVRGSINAFGDAKTQAYNVLTGKKFGQNPDLRYLPTGHWTTSKLQVIPRAMEAMDTFFQSLIKGGESSAQVLRSRLSGVPISEQEVAKRAADLAQYSVFRQGLRPKGQGVALNAIDDVTAAVMNMRKNVPGTKWMIPFIQTPMNILKQGVEYSPLGVLTIPGSEQKKLQVAKTFIGSMVTLAAWEAVSRTDSTWAAPTDPEEKELFYASGRKPYSIRIGDKWVSYSRIGVPAYPIAMAAAAKWNFEQDPDRFDQSTSDKMKQTLLDLSEFFTDQSYVQGIKTMTNLFDEGYEGQSARSQLASGPAKQVIPLSSLVGWVNRNFIDPVYRKAKTSTEQIKATLPILSSQLEAYTTPEGVPSERPGTLFSALSPVAITPAEDKYDERILQEQGARAYWDTLRERSDEEKNHVLQELYANNRSYYSSLLREINWDNLGVTTEERDIYKKGVRNGERAQAIINMLAGIEEKENKNALLRKLYEARIVTDEVSQQLREVLSKEQ
jgi:hypothetical protein